MISWIVIGILIFYGLLGSFGETPFMTIWRSFVMYLLLLFLLRITTRRGIRAASPLDLIVVFTIGGLATQYITAGDHSFANVGLAIVTIAGTHFSISSLKLYYPQIARVVDGTPVIVYDKDDWILERLRYLRLSRQDVLSSMRDKGYTDLSQIDKVVIERNGEPSILPKK